MFQCPPLSQNCDQDDLLHFNITAGNTVALWKNYTLREKSTIISWQVIESQFKHIENELHEQAVIFQFKIFCLLF